MAARRHYRLYVDESGNHQIREGCEQYLGLLGVIVPLESYESCFKQSLRAIKQSFFSSDPDTPVILHREEVVKRVGPFSVLNDDDTRHAFNRAMIDFYRLQDYSLACVVVDKHSMRDVFGTDARHPYHYASEALLERFFFFLRDHGAVGDVIAETRGKDQDDLLAAEWSRLCNDGTYYVKRKAIAQVFVSNQIDFRNKNQNVYGLQIADMLARVSTSDVLIQYDRKREHRSAFDAFVADGIRSKYRTCPDGSRIAGYGQKLLVAQKKPAPYGSACKPLPIGRGTTAEAAVRSEVSDIAMP